MHDNSLSQVELKHTEVTPQRNPDSLSLSSSSALKTLRRDLDGQHLQSLQESQAAGSYSAELRIFFSL